MNLIFPKTTSQSGFTTATLSSTNDKEASKIVKEIIQNSYDSAIEKKVKAKVKFKVEKIKTENIPFLKEYERVLGLIEKENLTEQERDILNEIKEYLNNEYIDVLYIMDNGIGFTKKNLIGMLSDGISIKAEGSSGSYGNGHFSIFNLSYLRFLIYFSKNIFSGHTILRTFIDDTLRDKNGFILKEELPLIEQNDVFGSQIPEIFKSKVSDGAVIAVLGFNYFLNKENWMDLVKAGVVRNFFVAIDEDRLEVEIGNKKIDKENLDLILQETKEINITPKFKEIYKFYSLLDKKEYIVDTKIGKVKIYLSDDLETNLAICRNGMYITSKLPSPLRKADFVGYSPFSVLILPLDLEISNLIKRAEGSLHEDIKFSRFSNDKAGKEKKKKLREAFREINEFIKSKLQKIENDSISVFVDELNTIMLKNKHDKKGKTKVNKISKKREKAVVLGAEKVEIKPSTADGKTKNKKLKIGKEILLKKFTSFMDFENKKLFISFESEYKDIFLKVRFDDGTDLTCERATSGRELKILEVKGGEFIDGFILVKDIKKRVDLEISYEIDLNNYVLNYQFFKAV